MKNIFKLFTNQYSKLTKLSAFTLAEIVIVMAIIGLIGVLGITNAKKDTDVAEKVTQLRKTYQIIDAAFAAAVAENGTIDTWGAGNNPTTEDIWNVVKDYFKFQRVCGTDSGCWKSGSQYGINAQESSTNIDDSLNPKAILSNGVSITIGSFLDHGDDDNVEEVRDILVDVNGTKGLNMYGNDIFGFTINKEGVVKPVTLSSAYRYPTRSGGTIGGIPNCKTIGVYCTGWVLKFGNMDYLKKCSDELDWNTKTSCR